MRDFLLAPAVYAFCTLAGGLGELPDSHLGAISRQWELSITDLNRLRLVRWPSEIENFICANTAAQRFGDLSQVPGFFFDSAAELWRMDLEPRFCTSGFLMPVTSRRFGYYEAMLCFRYPRDQRPFRLKTRHEPFREAA